MGIDFSSNGISFSSQGKSESGTSTGRPISSTTSYARLVIFHYIKQNFDLINFTGTTPSDNDVFATTTVVIEDEITSVNVSKSLHSSNPAGTFDIELLPSKNWKRLISPGDWALIYLYSGQSEKIDPKDIPNKNIVMIGNLDRISRSRNRNEETDRLETRYVISGRDFSKVFTDTDVFFNPYVANSANAGLLEALLVQRGLPYSGSPDTLVNKLIDVFLSKDGATFDIGSLKGKKTKPLNQWKIPRAVFDVIEKTSSEISIPTELAGIGGFTTVATSASEPTSFGEFITRRIEDGLPGFKQRGFLSTRSNGSLWSLLVSNSNELVNEIFVELERAPNGSVKPAIYLRPRPNSPFFGSSKDKTGPYTDLLKGKFITLDQIVKKSAIEITTDQIQFDNLGKDGKSRFNMWWMRPKQLADGQSTEFANLQPYAGVGPSLPMVDTGSISRHGLKRTDQVLEFVYETNTKNQSQILLQKQFLNQFYDQSRFNHILETGTIETNGIFAEVGRVLKVKSAGLPSKLYYIESYTHNWKFPNRWITKFSVTKGQYSLEESKGQPFIDVGPSDFGTDDLEVTNTSLTKTIVKRDSQGSSNTPDVGGFDIPGFDF